MDASTRAEHRIVASGASAFRWLSSSPLAAVLVLCVSWGLTGALWLRETQSVEHTKRLHFEQVAERVAAHLQDRMLAYEEMLQGASGLFDAVESVDRATWVAYFSRLGLDNRLRGAQFVGFAPLDHMKERTRLAFLYPESQENQRALGYQPFADPSQRPALARAQDTGLAALSDRVTLPVESQIRVQPGFVFYFPIYAQGADTKSPEARRKALKGYVLCALRTHDLLREMRFDLETDAVIDLFENEPGPGTLLFTSRGASAPGLSQDRRIPIGGHAWTLRVGSSPAFDANAGSGRPRLILISGGAFSLALAGLVLLGARYQRQFMATHEDLRQSHARYLSLVNSVPGTVFRVGRALPWRLEYVSEGMRELTGKPPEFWLSSKDFLQELVHPEDLPRVMKVVAWATARGAPFEVEYRVNADGEPPRWIRQRTRVIHDASGEAIGLNGVFSDITHTRSLMDSLARQRETLEEQVMSRTAELLLAKDAAESANRAKSRFLSTMSHELRTPLNAVLGFSTLLSRTESDAKRRAQLEKIGMAGKTLQELLDRVMDFARADAGMLSLTPAAFPVGNLLDAAFRTLQEGTRGRAIASTVSTSGEIPPTVVGDERRIREVLLELLDNALEYTASGSIGVELRAERHGNGIDLVFAVRDTGCGVEASHKERLFSAFEQADGSSTRRHGGIGLGLALAKRLVTLMSGDIGVEDNPGGGSVFWFSVRVQNAGDPASRLDWRPRGTEGDTPEAPAAEAATPTAPAEREALQTACAAIAALLRRGELQVKELLQTHDAALKAAIPSQLPAIIHAVEEFDFDRALAVLEDACRAIGLEMP